MLKYYTEEFLMQLLLGRDEFWGKVVRKMNCEFFLLLQYFGNKKYCPIYFVIKIFK